MRKELKWYYEREEEIVLVGYYYGIDNKCGYPLFENLTNIKTLESINHIHILTDDIISYESLDGDTTYIIRGYVTLYERKDKTKDYGLKDVIIEEI